MSSANVDPGAVALRSESTGMARMDVNALQQLGKMFAASGYFADARDAAQAGVKVMAGQELGIPPVAAMTGIYLVKGKVTLGGNLIASRIRAWGYDYRHKRFDNEGCVLHFFSRPDATGKRELLGESSFTADDARLAGLAGSDTYKKFPRNMFFNRAMSNGAKWYCPEVFCGIPVYTPEEMGARVDDQGDMVQEQTTPAQVAERKIAEIKSGKTYEEASSPEPATAEPEGDGLQSLLDSVKDFKSTLAAFEHLKASFPPDAIDYYQILSRFQMRHANEFKTFPNAKACLKALWEHLQNGAAVTEEGGQ